MSSSFLSVGGNADRFLPEVMRRDDCLPRAGWVPVSWKEDLLLYVVSLVKAEPRDPRAGFALDWLAAWDLRPRVANAKAERSGSVRGSSRCRRRLNLGQNDRSLPDRLA
jgi:hypothetical protein